MHYVAILRQPKQVDPTRWTAISERGSVPFAQNAVRPAPRGAARAASIYSRRARLQPPSLTHHAPTRFTLAPRPASHVMSFQFGTYAHGRYHHAPAHRSRTQRGVAHISAPVFARWASIDHTFCGDFSAKAYHPFRESGGMIFWLGSNGGYLSGTGRADGGAAVPPEIEGRREGPRPRGPSGIYNPDRVRNEPCHIFGG